MTRFERMEFLNYDKFSYFMDNFVLIERKYYYWWTKIVSHKFSKRYETTVFLQFSLINYFCEVLWTFISVWIIISWIILPSFTQMIFEVISYVNLSSEIGYCFSDNLNNIQTFAQFLGLELTQPVILFNYHAAVWHNSDSLRLKKE